MNGRILIISILALAAVALSACGSVGEPAEEVTLSGYANPDVLVDTAWVLDRLEDESVRLLDVSSAPEVFETGHLPGAQFVDWQADLTDPDEPVRRQVLSRAALSELLSELGVENDDTVVVYDDTNSLFAARAYWTLKYYQHDDVRIYNGGSGKWVADGQQLTDEVAPVEVSNYLADEPDPALRAEWEYVIENLEDVSVQFGDTRSPDEYLGIDVRAARGGHIPGAINLEWSNAVNADGTFLDARALADLYGGAGFAPDKEVITYCQTGVRAAHTWFVLHELLGYSNVRNYDGSWEEYGNNADSPIEQ